MNFKEVLFVITGGTIDSYYEGTKDTVIPSENSVIPETIKSFKLDIPTSFVQICMKDSRSLNEKDRNDILEATENASQKKIIITHGTYTMPDTARFLKANLKRNDQTIILTGSLMPIKGFSPSDGTFNLGFALAKIEEIKAGIYVSMNGHLFVPEEVVKIIEEGRFASIFNKN